VAAAAAATAAAAAFSSGSGTAAAAIAWYCRGGDGGQAREQGHDGPCCSVGLLPTIINNDYLFYLSLATTLLPLPLRILCRSAHRRVSAAPPR
jgi:hypothetical protein